MFDTEWKMRISCFRFQLIEPSIQLQMSGSHQSEFENLSIDLKTMRVEYLIAILQIQESLILL